LTPASQQYPGSGALAILWSSEVDRYHGRRQASTPLGQLLPYECVVCGPATWQQIP
jgi:hypothetical protein